MKKVNIFVLGAGGDIGQSILKILKEIDWIGKIIGTDINLNTASTILFDEFFKVPKCIDENYLEALSKILYKVNADLIIPISEPEIRFFHKENISQINGISLLMVNRYTQSIGLKKLSTVNFLKQKNFPYPNTQKIKDDLKLVFPLIAKPNEESGGKAIFQIENNTDLNYVKTKYPNHILQEYLLNDEGEFTCGLFRSSKSEIRSIIFNRDLMSGYSIYGEIINNKQIDNLLIKLAEELDLVGSINVQLRLNNGIPKVFEINPRFSSTVRFRDLFGFNDLLWALEDHLNKKISNYNKPPFGAKFFKGFEEYIS